MTEPASVASSAFDQTLASLLDDGLFIDGDWIETKDQDPAGEVRLIQLADVGDGGFRDRSSRFLTLSKAKEMRCTFLETGDILVARMPDPLGRACIFPEIGQPAVTAVDVCILRPNPNRARPEWLVKAINSPKFRSAMQEFVRGTTRQRISRKNLGAMTLAVPPLEVQEATAAFVDRAELQRRTAAGNVVTTRLLIARFRLSVLASATSGRLTSDWREQNGTSDGRNRSGESPDDTELPVSWSSASVDAIGDVRIGGTPSRKESSYWNGGIPWVSSGEVANCRIASTRETISPSGLANSNAKMYPANTVLIAMIGEGKTRGQSAILDIEASTNQNSAGIIPNRELIDPEYLWRWALAQYEVTRAVGRGGNQPALNAHNVRELIVPIPPMAEQHEIVRRVDALLALADSASGRLNYVADLINHTAQAILAKSFRGELLGIAV